MKTIEIPDGFRIPDFTFGDTVKFQKLNEETQYFDKDYTSGIVDGIIFMKRLTCTTEYMVKVKEGEEDIYYQLRDHHVHR